MIALPKEYAWGLFNASLRGLSGAVQSASSASNYTLNAARDCGRLTGGDEIALREMAERLDRAAATLREAAAFARKPEEDAKPERSRFLQAAE